MYRFWTTPDEPFHRPLTILALTPSARLLLRQAAMSKNQRMKLMSSLREPRLLVPPKSSTSTRVSPRVPSHLPNDQEESEADTLKVKTPAGEWDCDLGY